MCFALCIGIFGRVLQVFEFFPRFPWDFQRQCPLVRTDPQGLTDLGNELTCSILDSMVGTVPHEYTSAEALNALDFVKEVLADGLDNLRDGRISDTPDFSAAVGRDYEANRPRLRAQQEEHATRIAVQREVCPSTASENPSGEQWGVSQWSCSRAAGAECPMEQDTAGYRRRRGG